VTEQEDELLRAKLRQSILTAFDKWGARSFDRIVDPRTWKDNPEALEGTYLEDLFMSKRVFILGFFRYVTRQVRANEDFQRQVKTITKAILLSILHPSGVLPGEMETRSESDQFYTRRNVQHILRERYPETFFESGTKRPKGEGNVRPYSNIFSPHGEPPLERPITVRKVQLADRMIMESNRPLKEWIMLNKRAEVVFPEVLESLINFRGLCAELLSEMRDDVESPSMGKVLREELGKPTETLEIFHNHVLSIVSIGWFRSRQEETQRALIHDGFPLKYTEDDASVAVSLLVRLSDSEEETANHITHGAEALVEYGVLTGAALLYGQCLKLGKLGPLYRGILHENLATIHRKQGNPKLMVQAMKKAVECYREDGDSYRLAVSLKNLGEAEWMLGYTKRALEYFAQAEALGEGMQRPDRANVLANLAAAAMRVGQVRLEITYTKKFLECAPDDWTDKILNASARLGELSRR
jgi:tetratricopeptide (TPR) repeat protein